MTIIKHIFALFFIFLLATGCKTTLPTASRKKVSDQKELSDKQRMDFQYLFYNANKEKILGNYELAITLFHQALSIDKNSDATLYELARIYEKVSKNKEALAYAKKAVALNPDNVWYLSLLGESLQKNNMKNEAIEIYEMLVKKDPDNLNAYFDLANVLINAGKLNEAVKVYDKLEEKTGIKEEVSIQKERIYLKLNKVDKAIDELQKLIQEFPKETKYYSVLADLYQANDMPEKAFETYKKILEIEPDNAFVHLSMAHYYRSTGDKEKTFEELKMAFSNKNLDVETGVSILSSYFTIIEKFPEIKEQAFTLNKLFIATHPLEPKAYAIYGDFLYQDKQLDSARQEYRKAIKLDKERFMIWQQLIFIESALNDFNAMYAETEEAMSLFPNQPLVYLFNGIAKIQLQKHKEAIEVLNAGLKQVVDNKAMSSQFYAQLGDVYYKMKNNKESDIAFDKALEQDGTNSYVLNNYSYYLSLRGDSLNKAERMSLLSNTLEPDNSSFQDTYGWILYRLDKFSEAKIWLEKAMKGGGDKSAVILEHYGDVLYKLNDKDTALDYWNKAKTIGSGSEFLNKKIADQKLYE